MSKQSKRSKTKKPGQRIEPNPHDRWTCKRSEFQFKKQEYLDDEYFVVEDDYDNTIAFTRSQQSTAWCQYNDDVKDPYNHVLCSRPLYIYDIPALQSVKFI